ncbi:MAG: hypothetical protein HQ580_16210 [Planctomycetes bacterium]|nr:hypothetical protein [Planctomycetota bacterium]
MNSADNIERAVEQLHITTRAETDKHILDDAFVVLEKSAQKQSPHVGRSVRPKTLRIRIAELAAVAAVILVIFALFFGKSATDVGLGEIYQVIGAVENICITTFEPVANEPMQVEWVSQTLNIDMFRIGKQLVLWDIPNKVKMTKYLSSDSVKTQILSGEMLSKVKQAAVQRFGLVPFSKISDIPGARWTRLEDSEAEAAVSGTKVYDLTWQETNTASGAIKLRKWRVFWDRDTNLPKRTEWYSKLQSEEEYTFETFAVVTYPTESQIQVLIRNAFGSAPTQPRDPEYRGTPQPN